MTSETYKKYLEHQKSLGRVVPRPKDPDSDRNKVYDQVYAKGSSGKKEKNKKSE